MANITPSFNRGNPIQYVFPNVALDDTIEMPASFQLDQLVIVVVTGDGDIDIATATGEADVVASFEALTAAAGEFQSADFADGAPRWFAEDTLLLVEASGTSGATAATVTVIAFGKQFV